MATVGNNEIKFKKKTVVILQIEDKPNKCSLVVGIIVLHV